MKNSYKLFLCGIAGLFCFVSTGISQKNFKPGYIITNSNDSVKGSVDFREWGYNPAKINFINSTGQKQVFTPADIREFGIPPREYYVSRKVSLDLTSFDINDLSTFGNPRLVKDTMLFLTIIVKGKTSLLFIKDRNDREHFYIEKDNQPPEELILKKNMKKVNESIVEEKNYIVTTEIFKGQLILLFADCPSLKDDIDGSEYKTASLRSLVISYNECHPGGNVQFIKKQEKIRVRFGLLAGGRLSHLKFTGTDEDLPTIDFPSQYSFTVGASLYLVMPRDRAQYLLLNELVYQYYSTQGSNTDIGIPFVNHISNTFSFDVAYIKLNTLLRYQYPNWKIRPFANIGMSNGYSIKTSNTKVSEKHISNFITSESGPAIESFRKYEAGILVGAGASFLGLGVEFRVEWTNGMSSLLATTSHVRSYYLLVSYTF